MYQIITWFGKNYFSFIFFDNQWRFWLIFNLIMIYSYYKGKNPVLLMSKLIGYTFFIYHITIGIIGATALCTYWIFPKSDIHTGAIDGVFWTNVRDARCLKHRNDIHPSDEVFELCEVPCRRADLSVCAPLREHMRTEIASDCKKEWALDHRSGNEERLNQCLSMVGMVDLKQDYDSVILYFYEIFGGKRQSMISDLYKDSAYNSY
jgi:hypothetical protein